MESSSPEALFTFLQAKLENLSSSDRAQVNFQFPKFISLIPRSFKFVLGHPFEEKRFDQKKSTWNGHKDSDSEIMILFLSYYVMLCLIKSKGHLILLDLNCGGSLSLVYPRRYKAKSSFANPAYGNSTLIPDTKEQENAYRGLFEVQIWDHEKGFIAYETCAAFYSLIALFHCLLIPFFWTCPFLENLMINDINS